MGVLREPADYVKSLKLPQGFSVCELGDQRIACGKSHRAASEFYQELGCGRYVSIDANGRGTVTADLNLPVTALGTFDLVTDFGTGEHVFDQAQVWRTLHELAKPDRYIVFDRPHQGYGKHCFYLVDPCLYTDLAAANDYAVTWFEKKETDRGWLVRGAFRTPSKLRPFQVPQQGRYQAILQLPVVA